MYKLIFAFLCGFFTYGVATRLVPVQTPAQPPLAAAPADHQGSRAAAQPLNGISGSASAARMLPIYLPAQGSCSEGTGVCSWSI